MHLTGSPKAVTAAASRRRPCSPLYLSLGAVLWAASALSLVGCSKEPEFDVPAARSASTHALTTLGADEPEQTQHLKTLIELAEQATARERGEWFWNREDELIEAAWGRVAAASVVALEQLKAHKESTRNRWVEAERQATAALALARVEVKAPGLSRREHNLVQQAALILATARRLAATGELDRATAMVAGSLQQAGEVHEAWDVLHARFDDRGTLRRWKALVDETIAHTAAGQSTAFVVDKLNRRLYVYSRGRKVDSFLVELGAKGLKPKLHAGDRATPEGRYRVTEVRSPGETRYYKALMLDYPNLEDRARFAEAQRRGTIPRGVGPGSLIEIHGSGGKGKDWTDGCIALTNAAMDRLFRYAAVDTPVVIVGTVPEGGSQERPQVRAGGR